MGRSVFLFATRPTNTLFPQSAHVCFHADFSPFQLLHTQLNFARLALPTLVIAMVKLCLAVSKAYTKIASVQHSLSHEHMYAIMVFRFRYEFHS